MSPVPKSSIHVVSTQSTFVGGICENVYVCMYESCDCYDVLIAPVGEILFYGATLAVSAFFKKTVFPLLSFA